LAHNIHIDYRSLWTGAGQKVTNWLIRLVLFKMEEKLLKLCVLYQVVFHRFPVTLEVKNSSHHDQTVVQQISSYSTNQSQDTDTHSLSKNHLLVIFHAHFLRWK